jgi:hypothetical protein
MPFRDAGYRRTTLNASRPMSTLKENVPGLCPLVAEITTFSKVRRTTFWLALPPH